MKAGRFGRIDALRAGAMLWMTAYHFVFDLNFFGWVSVDMYRDPVWTLQRTGIVGLFLFCAGLGQAVAHAQAQSWGRFARRWAQVAGCALLVTAGSWWMFPHSFIYFGVLHGMAVMLLIVRLSAGWPARWLVPLAVLALLAPALAAPTITAHAGLDWLHQPWANWLGLIARKPITEDYVPVLPWLGLMWLGLLAGRWVLARRPGWLAGGGGPLAVLGRWSLSYYMLHQPVLLGLLAGLKAWAR